MSEHVVRIHPERRHYNRWVRNQTLEDYALRYTATQGRRWTCGQVANTAIGAGSFLALEAIGAAITLHYGFTNAAIAIATVAALIFGLSLPIAYHAARAGVDIDLLARGSGFGYLGSTVTSLIYASFTFLFFAIEAAIMATALELWLGWPLSVGYIVSSFVVIPVVLYGITLIGRFQRLSQPLWIVLQLAPFVFLAWHGGAPFAEWLAFEGGATLEGSGFDWLRFGAASAVLFSLVAQIGEQVDYLRFLPVRTRANRLRWWAALLVAGPGWIGIGALKLFAGSVLVVFALQAGTAAAHVADPVHMYLAAWTELLSAELALATTAIFVIVCQLKINVTNAYAGSIAWSNFFSRLTHSHPGRVVWVVFNVAIALLLMELGVYRSLEHTLGLYSIVAVAWIGALASDLAIAQPLGLRPAGVEFRRAHLYDINPVGIGAMAAGATLGLAARTGAFGTLAQALAGFVALAAAIALVPLLARLTRGRFYLAERDVGSAIADTVPQDADHGPAAEATCRVCEHRFEARDLTGCPAYGGPICSLCCTLDNRCEDRCRPGARASAQVLGLVDRLVPASLRGVARSPIARYLATLAIVALALAAVTTLVYLESTGTQDVERAAVARALQHLLVVLLIVAGVVTWIFLLISDSRRAARLESAQQNALLVSEVEAHELTERALEAAKEVAEAANQAKSRYLVGLSHELRSPLNSILGYAQLIDGDPAIPAGRRNAVRVIRQSSDHLAGLIESLLDISKIEAGRFTIVRERIELRVLLDQIADMFRLQARAQGLSFDFAMAPGVPALVHADGRRLRQVLINLLTNAIRYTHEGGVRFDVAYRSQVAEFSVVDTGVGISAADRERVFNAFETVAVARGAGRGTGLGLTITKLLAEIMGGDITLRSEPGVGSTFTVRLLLSSIEAPLEHRSKARVTGYTGPRRRIGVVEDDPAQRSLMTDLLEPLGFEVSAWADAESCLASLAGLDVDVFLLDISLPGMDGRELERELRAMFGAGTAMITVSANVDERAGGHIHDSSRLNHFLKPIDLDALLERLRTLLGFEWEEAAEVARSAAVSGTCASTTERFVPPDGATLDALEKLASIGHAAGLRDALRRLERDRPATGDFVTATLHRLERYDLAGVDAMLEGARAARTAADAPGTALETARGGP